MAGANESKLSRSGAAAPFNLLALGRIKAKLIPTDLGDLPRTDSARRPELR